MKAYYSIKYGGAESSRFGDYPDPVPGAGQILVEVKAVSINPVDFKVRNGSIRFLTGFKFPRIMGTDFSGVVRTAGKDAMRFKPGDRVYGMTSVIFRKQGALAQLIAVDQSSLFMMPSEMSFEIAASFPVAALTALNGLRLCRAGEGSDILINGGTGGVGHFAIQIARARGAHVTVTCNPKNEALALSLGARATMGYSRESFRAAGRKFDIIFDAYGHMNFRDINLLLKRGGRYATTMPDPLVMLLAIHAKILFGKNITISNLRSEPADIEYIERLFREGKLIPVIENYYTLDRAGDAFNLAEHGKPRGKIIVRI